jgi:hypothetical protein
MSATSRMVAGVLALFVLTACNPGPPKPKTEIERQASSQAHDRIAQPLLAKRPESSAKR